LVVSALILDPKPSVTKQVLIAAIHLVAAIAFWSADFPIPITVVVLIVILASGVVCVRAEHAQHSILEFEDAGAVTIRRCGVSFNVSVLSTSADMGWAIWLQWREVTSLTSAGRRQSGALMLMPDQCTPSEWRQLRIWLRHKSGAAFSDDRAEV